MIVEIRATHGGWEPTAPRWWTQRKPMQVIEVMDKSGLVYQYKIFRDFSCDFRSGGWGVDPIVPWADNAGVLSVWIIHDINCYGYLPWTKANALMLEMGCITTMGSAKARIAWLGVQPFKSRAWSPLDKWQALEPRFRANQGRVEFAQIKSPSLPPGLKISL